MDKDHFSVENSVEVKTRKGFRFKGFISEVANHESKLVYSLT